MEKKPFYITTPIYYPSGNPHIGHCYTTVACDSIARYRRMQGYDVMFLTGTDEHGLKIEQKAAEKGVTPKEYVDEIVKTFKKLWSYMNISYDRYIRTTDDYHIETVQKIFKALYDKGYIYKGEYKGKYCTPCESFWTESQLDENGCCPECHREVTEAKEEAYFFKMSPFAERIEKLLTETDYLQPKTRATELVNNFIKPGLEDLCVSRTSFKWGIPVTFDDKHVVYALGFWNEQYNDFDKFWPADVHMVAKDIMRFHAIIWPAMLMALDLPLPKHLAVHGWITFNGQKMSKSLGNVVDPFILGERYGADAIRYHILREMALGADSSFSNEIMINRINSDLANGLGNLVSRTVAMADKYFGGTLPVDREAGDFDAELIAEATTMPKVWEQIGAVESDITYENAGKFGVLPADVTVHRGEIIFPRIDVDKEIEELNKIIGSKAEPEEKADDGFEPAPIADEITIDDFAKVDLRVALVKACEKVKKSKKLLCLQLDDGFGGRQVVSGIAAWYKPEDLIGKKVVIVANLKPVKLCGVESNGMICAADTPDGAASVIFPDQDLPCGAKLR